MGSGAKKKHETYGVAPAQVPAGVAGNGLYAGIPVAGAQAADAALVAVEQFTHTPWGSGEKTFEDFLALHEAAKESLTAAANAGAGQIVAGYFDTLSTISKEYVYSLSKEQLVEIAKAQGVQHPGLLSQHALAGLLDPTHPMDHPYKQTIQAAGPARWAQLQAGMTLKDGTTLASYLADYPEAGATTSMTFTPEALMAKYEALVALAEQIKAKIEAPGYFYGAPDEDLSNLRYDFARARAEWAVAKCTDPEFNKSLFTMPYAYHAYVHAFDLPHLWSRIEKDYGLAPLDVELLAPSWGASPSGISDYIKAFLEGDTASLDAKIQSGKDAIANLVGYAHVAAPIHDVAITSHGVLALPSLEGATQAEVKKFISDLPDAIGAASAALSLSTTSEHIAKAIAPFSPEQLYALTYGKDKLAVAFRGWAKEQSIPELRLLAVSLGATEAEAKKWTKATIQNYIAGTFSPKAKAKFEAATQVAAPASPKAANPPPQSVAPAASSAASHAPPATPHGIKAPKQARFAAKKQAVADGLAHIAASILAVGKRPTRPEVENLKLSETVALASGGVHAKQFFTDQTGRAWMFKPDSGNVPRSYAEEAASEMLHQVGLPSVPVFVHTVNGKRGSVQPFVKDTTAIEASPKSWSQADVDAIVRYHVAAWMVGDYDGKPENVLRTKAGGLIPIDQAAAFKFVGSDKLDVDYHPISSFGSIPVYHMAYKAAQSGGLANGVQIRPEVVAPVIARFEAMPDDVLRDILRPYATRGVKTKVGWVPAMQHKAQAKYGTTVPSTKQVADTFIEAIVERKKNLRKDFSAFFSKLGFAEAGDLLEAVA